MGKVLNWVYLLFLIVTPVIFLILPADYFNTGPVLCPSKRLFDIECYGCGMTRAIQYLIHFDFDSALYYNALSFIVAPVLAGFWIKWTIKAARDLGLFKKYLKPSL